MNHDKPRQREKDKRWDFTTGNRRSGTHPAGYCQGWRPIWDLQKDDPMMRSWYEKAVQFKDKYHTDGHASAEEAAACYFEFVLDNRIRHGEDSNSQHKCRECGAWTSHFVEVDHAQMLTLCDKHSDRDTIAKHADLITECWHS